jgi:hypothetical protein
MARPKGQKCGNCIHFQVRNEAELDLARVAKNESECAPGEWVFEGKRKVGCHGGPVQGMCAKWKERGAQGPSVLSTQWCKLWAKGGPSLRRAGSFNQPVAEPSVQNTPTSKTISRAVDRNAAYLATGLVALLVAAGHLRQGR